MIVEGTHRVQLPMEVAWSLINDPQVIQRCAPGMEKLEAVSENLFNTELNLGLAAISGRFTGHIFFLERQSPKLHMKVEGKGAPGFMNGEVTIFLDPAEGGKATDFRYSADFEIGGTIAHLGQRLIPSMAKEMAAQFFVALEQLGVQDFVEPPVTYRTYLRLLWGILTTRLSFRP